MPERAARKKDPAAVALGRKGGNKGGLARAAKLTPTQRSESARNAVQARWTKAKQALQPATASAANPESSDEAVLQLLSRIKVAANQDEIRQLSDELERVIFHKQYARS